MKDLELIRKYVNGEDIEGIKIEELENDRDFMIGVIDYTNDKNFYNLCSEELKQDDKFCIFLLKKFKKDLYFCAKVFANYSDGVTISDDSNKSKTSEKSELGFSEVLDDYKDRELMIIHYGKNMIDYIFSEYDINLEKLLHEKFSTKKELLDFGISNFMIEFLSKYDKSLSLYASSHESVLDEFRDEIDNVLYRWDWYESELLELNIVNIIDRTCEYLESDYAIYLLDGDFISFDVDFYLFYIAREFGLYDKFISHFNLTDELIFDLECSLKDKRKVHLLTEPKVQEKINAIRNIFKEELKNRELVIFSSNSENNNLSRCRRNESSSKKSEEDNE